MKRIFALDYGRGTMAGFYTDFGAKVISPRPIMDKDGEPSGFALMQDGSYRLGKQLYTMGAKDYRNATAMHINIKELPTGDDSLQVEYARAWRQKLLRDNPTLFNDGSEEVWIIGCPTGWRSSKVIDKYRVIFEEAGFSNPIIVPESNAAMMYAQQTYEFMDRMDKNTGVLCIDLGAYSADSTYVRPGSVSSYGGYVGASLIEKMILEMNLSGEFCEDSRNSKDLRQKVREKCQSDPMFRTYMLLHAKKLKESYFTDVVNGQDYSDIDCTEAVDIRINDAALDAVGVKFFELVANDRMMRTITEGRSIKDVLGEEFDALPEEVRKELGNSSWRESLKSFVCKTLEVCPEFAMAAKDTNGDKANLILTGGASLMPLVMDVMQEVMPNTNIYNDREPMSTIAKGLVYFGPEKIKAMEFDAEFQRLLSHNANGEVTDGSDNVLNVIMSEAHDKLGLGIIGNTAGKMIGVVVEATRLWSNREFDSDKIIPTAIVEFKKWFDGEMRTDYTKSEEDTKVFIAQELNKRFSALLNQYGIQGDLLAAPDIDLQYADRFLEVWGKFYDHFQEMIAEENAIYSRLSNPGAVGSFFGTSRAQELSVIAEQLDARNEKWFEQVTKDLLELFNSKELYTPFAQECLFEMLKALNEAKKSKLGELVVEESFDDMD